MDAKCGAKTRAGGSCANAPLSGSRRCKFHGGKALWGPANPSWKHGRHSQLVRTLKPLGAHYARALVDPDLLRLDDEIALTDARLAELLERAGREKTPAAIDRVWPEVEELIESRRRLVDTASKRLRDQHAMVSIDRVMALVGYVSAAVTKHVSDRTVLAAVHADLARVLRPGQYAAAAEMLQ